ncbi:helix-turn-helix transcriptional regulator [Pseudomonas sp. NPDC079086]|jgi:predicted transcriptional regulator|uniref:helix-turn-helix transcriptional regulator n=1 Tax=unclassified Pseudomonas TaxID=196821 RepID=UPI0037C97424
MNSIVEFPVQQAMAAGHRQALRSLIARDMAFLTQEDVAELAAVSLSTVESWRKHNSGPAYVKFGRAFLYPTEKLVAFLQERMCDREEDKREIMKRCLRR